MSGLAQVKATIPRDLKRRAFAVGRIYGFGDRAKPNNASKRPLTQASLRCKR